MADVDSLMLSLTTTAAAAAAAGHAPTSRHTYRSPGHQGSMMSGLDDLRQSGILFDVVLQVEGRPIHAHRILLAAACPYFRGMFAGGLREVQQTEIPVHGVTHGAMSKLLDFIYTSEIELDLDNVQEVLAAATLVQMDDVITFCCEFLFSWLDESNILEVHRLADVFGLPQLQAKVHLYLLQNIQSLARTEAFRRLPPGTVLRALGSQELEVDSEEQVYEAALLYHHGPEQADQVCLQDDLRMLEAVRFGLMERASLQRLSGRLDGGCPRLRASVAAALRYQEQELLRPALQDPQTRPRAKDRCILGFGGMYSSAASSSSSSSSSGPPPHRAGVPDSEGLFQVLLPGWGEWRTLGAAALVPRMSNQGVAVLNDFVYLVGGDKNTSGFRAETRCWRYDPRHNSWCSVQPLQQQHADHAVCVLGGYIYAVGGRDYSNELDAVERYDPRTNAWEYVAPLKREVYAHAGAVVDGKMYVTCGRRGDAYLSETYCFDPAAAAANAEPWTACSDGPVERAWHGAAGLRGRVYVIGGSNNALAYRCDVLKVACFDPAADSWSLVSPLPAGHGEPGVAVLDSLIYVLGGRSHDRGRRTRRVHVYRAADDRWDAAPPFPGRVSGLAACALPLPRAVLGRSRRQQQQRQHRHAKQRGSSREEAEFNSEYSSDD